MTLLFCSIYSEIDAFLKFQNMWASVTAVTQPSGFFRLYLCWLKRMRRFCESNHVGVSDMTSEWFPADGKGVACVSVCSTISTASSRPNRCCCCCCSVRSAQTALCCVESMLCQSQKKHLHENVTDHYSKARRRRFEEPLVRRLRLPPSVELTVVEGGYLTGSHCPSQHDWRHWCRCLFTWITWWWARPAFIHVNAFRGWRDHLALDQYDYEPYRSQHTIRIRHILKVW